MVSITNGCLSYRGAYVLLTPQNDITVTKNGLL